MMPSFKPGKFYEAVRRLVITPGAYFNSHYTATKSWPTPRYINPGELFLLVAMEPRACSFSMMILTKDGILASLAFPWEEDIVEVSR